MLPLYEKNLLEFSVLALFVCGVFFCTSCEKNVPVPKVETDKWTVDTTSVFTWSYSDFDSESDVQIMSPDTSSLRVTKSFLKKVHDYEFLDTGCFVCAYLAVNKGAFIRKITDISDDGDAYLITTVQGNVDELFEELDIVLSGVPYYNSTKAGSSDSPYMDADGVLHPIAIVMENGDALGQDSVILPGVNYFPDAQDVDFTIRLRSGLDFEIPLTNDTTLAAGVKDGYFELWTTLTVELNIKKFKLQHFKTAFAGGYNLDVPVYLKAGGSSSLIKKEKKIGDLPGFTFTFSIGPIPVSVTIDPSVEGYFETKLSGKVKATTGFSSSANFTIGAEYNRNQNPEWHSINEKNSPSIQSKPFAMTAEAELSLEAGLRSRLSVKLYGCAGPTGSVGPYAKFTAAAKIGSEQRDSLEIDLKAAWGVKATAGAQFSIWKWKIGKWETSFDLINEISFLDYKFRIPFRASSSSNYVMRREGEVW